MRLHPYERGNSNVNSNSPAAEVGQTYTVADFETYEYRHQILTGSKSVYCPLLR